MLLVGSSLPLLFAVYRPYIMQLLEMPVWLRPSKSMWQCSQPIATLCHSVLCCAVLPQATLSGLLTAGMFYFISAAKPLEELSATRPHPSIFCAYFFTSLLGQFAMHLTFLIVMYRWG